MIPLHRQAVLASSSDSVTEEQGLKSLYTNCSNPWSPGQVEQTSLSVAGRLIALSWARNAAPQPTIICGFKQLPLSGQLQVGKGLLVAVMEERAQGSSWEVARKAGGM